MTKPKRPRGLVRSLFPIFDAEVLSGNRVASVERGDDEVHVRFALPLQQEKLEALELPDIWPFHTPEPDAREGFECMESSHTITGPRPPRPSLDALAASRPLLRVTLEVEVRAGNASIRVDESATCVGVAFRDPLHTEEILAALGRGADVEAWEAWDTHHPVEAGLRSRATGDSVSGPPKILTEIRALVADVESELREGQLDLIAARSAGKLTVEGVRATLGRIKLAQPPKGAFALASSGTAEAALIAFPSGRKSFRVFFPLWTARGQSMLSLMLTFRERAKGRARMRVDDVGEGVEPGEGRKSALRLSSRAV